MSTPNSFKTGPDERGLFGIFGGRFVAETLMPLILIVGQRPKAKKASATPICHFRLDRAFARVQVLR